MATITENLHAGNGSKKKFSFKFPYLQEADVKVYLFVTDAWVLKTLKTDLAANDYFLANATTIEFTSAPAAANPDEQTALGDTNNIKIKRLTNSDSLSGTFYPGSAIRSSDLNDNFTQNLYVTQEANNNVTTATTDAAAAVVTADAAETKADTAISTADDAEATAEAAEATADAAEVTADAAEATADAADAIADAAKLATDTYVHDGTSLKGDGLGGNPQGVKYAVVQAAAAVSTADDADTNATSALDNSRESDGEGGYNSAISIANTADDNADDALRATDRLVATTTDDGSTWTLAGNNTNASTDPKGVGYAVTQAEDAVDKANAASAAVAASAIYSVTADLSSLTSDSDYAINSTNHEKFVQVNDTSGITLSGGTWSDDFATSSGASFPTSFDGHSQLSLKLRINNTTGKYDVQEYYANDPEARYGEDRKVVVENNRTITDDYTIQTTMNALSVGPVSIDSGKTLTIPANSRYVVL